MKLFARLFGRNSAKESLILGCMSALDETERVYRNQVAGRNISGKGLLKARLFTASFMVAAYVIGRHGKNENDLLEVMQACSGAAMKPFNNPLFKPQVSKYEALEIATDFMSKVLKLINEEIKFRQNNIGSCSNAFQQLVDIYRNCLAESAGGGDCKDTNYGLFSRYAEGVVWANLRLCTESIQALR